MSEKEKFECKQCDLNCKIVAKITMEGDRPTHCPFNVLPTGGYEQEPKWQRK